MPNSIKVETDELITFGETFKTKSDELLKCRETVVQTLKDIDNNWQGRFAKQLSNQIGEIEKQMGNMSRRVREFGEFMVFAAHEYTEADRTGKKLDEKTFPPTVEISLKIKIIPICQKDYGEPIHSVGCSASSWAMCKSYTDNKNYQPTDFWDYSGNQAVWTGYSNLLYEPEATILREAYNSIKAGKPCVVGQNPYHYVCVKGIVEGADPNNLTRESFLIVDPGDGKEKRLSEASFKGSGTVEQELVQIIIP